MTVREAIIRAHEAVAEAEANRTATLARALDLGVTTREIADVLDVGHTTIWRWAGGRGSKGRGALDTQYTPAAGETPKRGQR